MPILKPDVCVVGAGSGGLSVAVRAAKMGAKVVIVEGHRMGGDGLNYGCIPSKSLLACAKAYHRGYVERILGVHKHPPDTEHTRCHEYVHSVIQGLEPHDSQERMQGLGIQVVRAMGSFKDPRTLEAGDHTIQARYFVIATGSAPQRPNIGGLEEVPYLTNETLFDLKQAPEHLVVIGGGPIGVEMAQAHLRLGSKVTLLQRSQLLMREDPEAVAYVRKSLQQEGLNLFEDVTLEEVQVCEDTQVCVGFSQGGDSKSIKGSHLLIAIGRRPRTKALNLDAAGVEYSSSGIQVSKSLQTSNKRIYAIGDVIGQEQFTHIANAHADVVLKRMLLRLPTRFRTRALPWVTYTEPEVAQVGLSERMLKLEGRHDYTVIKKHFNENDRAATQSNASGFIKVIATLKGRVLGVTLVGPQAGELLLPWSLMINKKLKLSDLNDCIVPYPTLSELSKAAASSFYAPTTFGKPMRFLVRLLARLLP